MSQVSAELTSGMVVSMTNGRHKWAADEPADEGGTDSGPNPYELLLSSLAACTCLTIAMYCNHKKMEFESIRADFEFDNVHASDCAECDDDEKGYIQIITSKVHVSGDFDAAQKKRLAEIATRCPVHKTLDKGVRFRDSATFDD